MPNGRKPHIQRKREHEEKTIDADADITAYVG